MKVVTVYTPGALLEETALALRASMTYVEWDRYEIAVGDLTGYGKILAANWGQCLAKGESLFVLEPDIIIRDDVRDAFLFCPEPYCAFPYELLTDIMPALGCTRFSASFIAKYPTLMRDAVATRVGFRQFDIVVQRHLLVARYGEQPHVHLPPVEHKNPAKKLRSDASSQPLTILPGFTFPLMPEGE